jgi:hypothetical protein
LEQIWADYAYAGWLVEWVHCEYGWRLVSEDRLTDITDRTRSAVGHAVTGASTRLSIMLEWAGMLSLLCANATVAEPYPSG